MYEHKQDYDFSKYPKISPYYNKENKMAIGKIKDELKEKLLVKLALLEQKHVVFL